MAVNAQQLEALVQQSREEQAVINKQLDDLRQGFGGHRTETRTYTELGPLREKIAELESKLLEREEEVRYWQHQSENVQRQLGVELTSESLKVYDAYEQTQKEVERHERVLQKLKADRNTSHKELEVLSKYLKSASEKRNKDDGARSNEADMNKQLRAELQMLQEDQQRLEKREGRMRLRVLRSVYRATSALAAGHTRASVGSGAPFESFAILHSAPEGGALLEFFSEPDMEQEMLAVDLRLGSGCSVAADATRLRIQLHGASVSGSDTVQLSCGRPEEYIKWTAALCRAGLLPAAEVNFALARIYARVDTAKPPAGWTTYSQENEQDYNVRADPYPHVGSPALLAVASAEDSKYASMYHAQAAGLADVGAENLPKARTELIPEAEDLETTQQRLAQLNAATAKATAQLERYNVAERSTGRTNTGATLDSDRGGGGGFVGSAIAWAEKAGLKAGGGSYESGTKETLSP
jgi:hypothetical protein